MKCFRNGMNSWVKIFMAKATKIVQEYYDITSSLETPEIRYDVEDVVQFENMITPGEQVLGGQSRCPTVKEFNKSFRNSWRLTKIVEVFFT